MTRISTVITKPTKGCNADCSYCSAPPDGAPKWSLDDFRSAFDALLPRLSDSVDFIWHGGEPMLLGTDFYYAAFDYARARLPNVRFSMQSNILGYNARWNEAFRDIFHGAISTSWDPDEINRTVKGRADLYARVYHDRMDRILADGWRPKVISTFDDSTIHLVETLYERACASSAAGRPHDIRINYRYPAGRAAGEGPALAPRAYADALVAVYDRWIHELPGFTVTPLDQMLLKTMGSEAGRCPWTKGCTGRIIGLEPNFDVYNCGEFADLGDPAYRFGNLFDDGIEACMTSAAARTLALRTVRHPDSCKSCIHFTECEGGCMRDSVLFGRGVYGKFYYCESWQEVFSRIKESVLSGEADGAIAKFGRDPSQVRRAVHDGVADGLAAGRTNMRRAVLPLGHMPDLATLTAIPGPN